MVPRNPAIHQYSHLTTNSSDLTPTTDVEQTPLDETEIHLEVDPIQDSPMAPSSDELLQDAELPEGTHRGRVTNSGNVAEQDPKELHTVVKSYAVAALIGGAILIVLMAICGGITFALLRGKDQIVPLMEISQIRKHAAVRRSGSRLDAHRLQLTGSRANTESSEVFGEVMGSSITLTAAESATGTYAFVTLTQMNNEQYDMSKLHISLMGTQIISAISPTSQIVVPPEGKREVETVLECTAGSEVSGTSQLLVACFLPPNLNVKNAVLNMVYDGIVLDRTVYQTGKISYSTGLEVIRHVVVSKENFSYLATVNRLAQSLGLLVENINIVSIAENGNQISVQFEIVAPREFPYEEVQNAIDAHADFFETQDWSQLDSVMYCDPCTGHCSMVDIDHSSKRHVAAKCSSRRK